MTREEAKQSSTLKKKSIAWYSLYGANHVAGEGKTLGEMTFLRESESKVKLARHEDSPALYLYQVNKVRKSLAFLQCSKIGHLCTIKLWGVHGVQLGGAQRGIHIYFTRSSPSETHTHLKKWSPVQNYISKSLSLLPPVIIRTQSKVIIIINTIIIINIIIIIVIMVPPTSLTLSYWLNYSSIQFY